MQMIDMSEIDELKKVLKKHEERISALEKLTKSKQITKKINTDKIRIEDLLIEIKEDGFFDKPKFRDDVVKKLEELGYIYSSDSLNGPLLRSVKSRKLGRKKVNGKWGYVKR